MQLSGGALCRGGSVGAALAVALAESATLEDYLFAQHGMESIRRALRIVRLRRRRLLACRAPLPPHLLLLWLPRACVPTLFLLPHALLRFCALCALPLCL